MLHVGELDLIDGDVCAFMTDGITEAFDDASVYRER